MAGLGINKKPVPRPPRVLAVANQKGGVGKTTTAINLATAMVAVDMKVLIIDLDPQGNASTGLGIPRIGRELDSYAVISGTASMAEATLESSVPGLSIIPSSAHLSGAEIELVTIDKREYRLCHPMERHLEGAGAEYDYILIDCPPSLGLLTLNAFVAADAVLVPLQCEFYALEGLSMLLKTVERVRRAFNPDLEIQGVVLTMFDRRNNLSEQVAADVREHLGDKVYETVIPRNVRVSESPSHGLPVLIYDMCCAGAQAYIHLAGEVIKRERSLAA
ncbi:MAG: chromosome partitioning protein ParA [Rhodospirillaceae bacterium]|nr:chromosome partitioning protein ParA [Rhodospirillaceae bacterium]